MKTLTTVIIVVVAAFCVLPPAACTAEEQQQSQDQNGAATNGKLDDVVVRGKDALKIEREKQPLDLNLDYMKILLPTLQTSRSFLDKLSDSMTVLKPVYQPALESEGPVAPWFSSIVKGSVASFQLERGKTPWKKWEFIITDTRGNPCRSFSGSGSLPENLVWDGRDANGKFLEAGNTYSYVLVVTDKAGNRRTTIGKSFVVAATEHQENEGLMTDISLTSLFDGKKDPLVLLPGGVKLLRETADTLKEHYPTPFAVRVYSESEALAQQQAKVLADYFARQLSLEGEKIIVEGYSDVPERYHAAIVIKNRKERHQ
jgi:hypothetical protein